MSVPLSQAMGPEALVEERHEARMRHQSDDRTIDK